MAITAGIDVGTSAIKTVLLDVLPDRTICLNKRADKIRNRPPLALAADTFVMATENAGLARSDIAYVASTGEAEELSFATGHFFSMTSHARGGVFLDPAARAVVDIGALHSKAIRIDRRGKVLAYKMSPRCASGGGRFLENISRYLGIMPDEIGELSRRADAPEVVSTVCAVLAETDVINMVSRRISRPNILKGIHLAMALKLVKLLRASKVTEGVVLLTGGLAHDVGLVAAIDETLRQQSAEVTVRTHPDSVYAGALGAALWGAFRYHKLHNQGIM